MIDFLYTKGFFSTKVNHAVRELGNISQIQLLLLRRSIEAKPLVRIIELQLLDDFYSRIINEAVKSLKKIAIISELEKYIDFDKLASVFHQMCNSSRIKNSVLQPVRKKLKQYCLVPFIQVEVKDNLSCID